MPDGAIYAAGLLPAGVSIVPLQSLPDRAAIAGAVRVLQNANRRQDGSVSDRFEAGRLWDHLYDSIHCRLPDRPRFLVAVTDGQVVGVGGYRPAWISAHGWELAFAGVDPDWQGRGIGAVLLRARLAAIRQEGGEDDFVLVRSRRPVTFRRYGFCSCALDPSVMLARVGCLLLPAEVWS